MIAIVESPYQLKNALSLFAEMKLDIDDFQVFVRDNGSHNQKEQFLNYQENFKFTYFYIPAKGILKIPLLIWFYLKYFLLLLSAKEVTLGDARSIVCKPLLTFMKKNFYLVDDGLYLISYIEQLRNTKCFVYTSLPLKTQKTDKFQIIKKNTPKYLKYHKVKSISFIGQPLVEMGFIKDVNFFGQLEQIVKYYSYDYINFDYYAHRYESVEKLNRVRDIGFNIIHLPTSIESFFYQKKAPIGVFISYYSTALLNISLAHKSLEAYFIDSKLEIEDKSLNDALMLCFDVFLGVGIRRFNLQ